MHLYVCLYSLFFFYIAIHWMLLYTFYFFCCGQYWYWIRISMQNKVWYHQYPNVIYNSYTLLYMPYDNMICYWYWHVIMFYHLTNTLCSVYDVYDVLIHTTILYCIIRQRIPIKIFLACTAWIACIFHDNLT